MKKIIVAIIAVAGLGLVSQVVERTMDKEAVKEAVTSTFKTPTDEKTENGGN
ncbi:hypothetical protein JZO70_10795 [Enterococcus sp. 669A]|uniref:Uncharacterized protein n=1 Tax=Candidatus Enterococcus moelleringii TaxID=2815325 RepID=A0ABS3LAI9_9ENTE|nr:hypothetical protein [Enterococcus sp. 669A]MBO1306652.1 hypothetical protein [Enterococcus sp. 669A]